VRRLYTLLLYLALPWASLRLAVQGLRDRDYWRGWSERFGVGAPLTGGGLWVHAVSVGEVQAALILIAALKARAPDEQITLTSATPTGRARAQAQSSGDACYAPYDLPGSLKRFLRRVRPRLLIIVETELWPNLLHAAWQARIPTLVASARVSDRTARFYTRIPGLLRPTLEANVWVAAQSAADARRFTGLGVPPARTIVAGNLKFDRSVPAQQCETGKRLRSCYAAARPLWVAGSTHSGEEAMVLEAHRQILQTYPWALLVLAPRHPQRFDGVAAAVAATGLKCLRRSQQVKAERQRGQPEALAEQVLLLDTLGELTDFYAAADLAFVGGSLVPVGGHNLLEPAAMGIPVLSGPHQFNSPKVAQALTEQGALMIVQDAHSLATAVTGLLAHPDARAARGAAAQAAIAAHRGALARILELIDRLGPQRASDSMNGR
jgi:3-deoxy-D-manno-octulosonic-acid transferase